MRTAWNVFLGALVGLASGSLCWMAAGFGHGTYIPAALSFGPWLLAISAFKNAPDWLFFSMPMLYCIYGAVLSRTRRRRLNLTALFAIHYYCALVWIYKNEFEFERFRRIWNNGSLILLGWAAAVLIANLLALRTLTGAGRSART